MAIKYYLQPNPITPDPNDQSARVALNQTLDLNSIISKMLKRGSTITEADIRAVMNIFFTVVGDEVADGNSVVLPIVNIRPGISGVFANATDSFDKSRHLKKATLSAGTLLNEKMSFASVEKIQQPLPSPVLIEFTDITSQTTNSILTPGGIGQIIGEELKFNPANENEVIFLINYEGTTLRISIIAIRTEGKLMFSIPSPISPGTYTLEIRKGYGVSQSLRSGTLADSLTVN